MILPPSPNLNHQPFPPFHPNQPFLVSSLPQEMNKIATNNSLCLVSPVVFLPAVLWHPVSSKLVPLFGWQVLGRGKLFSRYRKWKWLKLSVMAHPHLEEGRGLEAEWGREIRVIWAIFHCRLLRPRLTSGQMIAVNGWYGRSICVSRRLLKNIWYSSTGWVFAKLRNIPRWDCLLVRREMVGWLQRCSKVHFPTGFFKSSSPKSTSFRKCIF